MEFRLLSAFEALEAGREAEELIRKDRERALCANACLLARALTRGGKPAFESGQAVLAAMPAEEIAVLARRWSRFNREENPGLDEGEERTEQLKKASSTRRKSALSGACCAPLARFLRRRGSGR